MIKQSTAENQPSGLTKMLDTSGRTRGKFPTPVESGPSLMSPQPQRNLHGKIDIMHNERPKTSTREGSANRSNKSSSQRDSVFQIHGGHHESDQSLGSRSVGSPDNQRVEIAHHGKGFSAYHAYQDQDIRYSHHTDADPSDMAINGRWGTGSEIYSIVRSCQVDKLPNSDHSCSVQLTIPYLPIS